MRKLSLTLLLLACAATAFAKYEGLPPEVQTAAASISKYPKASSILLWSQEKYTMAASGAVIHEVHTFRYLPDDASRDTWGDPIVQFIDGSQKLEVIVSRAYTKDGRKVDSTPKNAFNPSTPEALQFAPEHSQFRDMVITMLGLENGCIAELHYKLTTEKTLYPWMYGRAYFRDATPVISRELDVELPNGEKLHYQCAGGLAEPKVTGSAYTWIVGETKGFEPEDLDGHIELLPNVEFTTAGDWREVQGELKARIDRASSGDLAIPESLTKAVAGINEDENKFDAIRTWVRERFNVLEYPHPDFAVTLRPVKAILQSGYGNKLELATLVSKLTEHFGLSAGVMLQIKSEALVPSLCEVSGADVAFRAGDSYFICDPVAPREEITQSDLAGNTLVPCNTDEKTALMPVLGASTNSFAVSIAFEKLDADTLSGTGTLVSRGQLAPYEVVRGKGAEAYVQDMLAAKGITVTKATVKELILGMCTIDFSFTATGIIDTAGNYRTLPLSLCNIAQIAKGSPMGLLQREFPQQIHIPGEMSLRIDAEIPEGWGIVSKHPDLSSKQGWGETSIMTNVKDNRLSFTRSIKLNDQRIPVSGWPEFRHWLLGASVRADNCIVFSVKK